MLLGFSLAPFFALANAIAANPIIVRDCLVSLPLARYINASGAVGDLVRRDRERAKSFMKPSNTLTSELTSNVEVTNAINFYTASIGVGTPSTYYNLVVDTGSSITWVGAQMPYVNTNTSVNTSNLVSVTYGSASFFGTEYTDTVTITPSLSISQQSIGVASSSAGFNGVDGIFGIGPVDLTIGALQPAENTSIPTVTDNLFKSGAIPSSLVSVSFEPTTAKFVKNGELTFGGTDPTKFTGSITYASLTTTSPANRYWGVNQSIQYDASVRILDNSAGIVDTGTTLILISSDAFERYRDATGAVLDPETHLLRITPAQFPNLKSLFFTISGATFELTANAQIWPRALNGFLGGKTDYIYLIVNDIGTGEGAGLDFVNGYTFLERFYTVFDTTNRRVGFATTPFTMANSN